MLKHRSALLTLAVLAVMALPAVAVEQQRGPHKWWQSPGDVAELGLTPQQSADIEAVFQASLPKLRDAKRALDQFEKDLSALVADPAVDEGQVSQLADRVEAARGELNKGRTLMLFRIHRLLNPEQRVKLQAIHERWEKDRERGRSDRDRRPRPEGGC